MRTTRSAKSQRGGALIFALSLLAIFGIMGVAYVDYMNTNLLESDLELRKARARQLAVSGVHIAAAALREEVLSPNHEVVKGVQASVELPTYNGVNHGEDGISVVPMTMTRVARTTFTVFDESGRVNLNHAPASALQKLLGVDGEAARNIAASVPRGAQGPDARWFLTRDELLTRGLLAKEQYNAIPRDSLTTVTVLDHANPAAHFNVNAAEPAALAAMLNVTLEQAQQVKAKGPFVSLEALGQAIAAVTGAAPEVVTSDPALGLKSRCFRVVSEGFYARAADQIRYDAAATPEEKEALLVKRTTSTVEAVLLFQDDGTYEIIDWSASPGDASQPGPTPEAVSVETVETAPVAPVAESA